MHVKRVAGALGARAGLFEAGEVRVHPTGKVTIFTGSHSHGQGHETTFAQLVSDRLGVDINNVAIVHGDTDKVQFGMGTYGSRSLAVGGSACRRPATRSAPMSRAVASLQDHLSGLVLPPRPPPQQRCGQDEECEDHAPPPFA